MVTIRTFIGIELSQQVQVALGEVGQSLSAQMPRGAVRWVKPERMHLTLSFLGETAVSTLPAIAAGLDQIGTDFPPFKLKIAGVGCFPNRRRPRVVWAGLGGNLAQLAQLKRDIDRMLQPLGWEAEKRPFRPHLTLGRVKDSRKLRDIRWEIEFEEMVVAVTAVSFIESQFQPTGPIYTIRHSAQLVDGTTFE